MPRLRRATPNTPEAKALDETARAFSHAEARLEKLRVELRAAVIAAVRAGMSKAEAGRRAGYSREYVSGLVRDADARDDAKA